MGGLVCTWLAILLVFTLLRTLLLHVFVGWNAVGTGEILRAYWIGLRFDAIGTLGLTLPLLLLRGSAPAGRARRVLLCVFTFGAVLFSVFFLGLEFLFFEEYNSRLNYIAYEYLAYSTEVFGNIWESYPLPTILGGVLLLAGAIYAALRPAVLRSSAEPLPAGGRAKIFLAAAVLFATLFATTGMDDLGFSRNRLVNEAAGNGMYSFFWYAWTGRFDYAAFYDTIDPEEAARRLAERIFFPQDRAVPGSTHPLDRIVAGRKERNDYNVVLILEESLGSDFVGVLGDGRGITPRLDALTREGLLFDRFFATGNRTARALEATLVSLPPIPTESILVRDHNRDVFTLARVLETRGYRRTFIYGGRGLFDGMRAFAMENGFERFVEQKDYPNPTFVTPWGVCDEDIFHRSIEEFDRLAADSAPFFATIVTISNHKPYTYPAGRIDLPSEAKDRAHAVKYADWALGEFFDRVRTKPYFARTIFLVMGDHGARVYGAQRFPLKSYRVPVLVLGPTGTKPGSRVSTLASSLDIAPTILGFLGGSYRSVFFGRDAMNLDPDSGGALLQHNHQLVYLKSNNEMTLLEARRGSVTLRADTATWGLAPLPDDREARADAISYYQMADALYYSERLHPDPARP